MKDFEVTYATCLVISANLFRNAFNAMELSDLQKKDIIEECEQFINSFDDRDLRNAISFVIAGASCREMAKAIAEADDDE